MLTRGRLCAAGALFLGAAAGGVLLGKPARCQPEHQPERRTGPESSTGVGGLLSSVAAGASIVAAAAPALCAVHCAATPILVVALPSLQLGGSFGSICMHSVGRKLALYFVVPLGLISNAVGYPQHKSAAVTSSSLLGVAFVTAAATVKSLAPHRNVLNGIGCVLMLGASYRGRLLEQESSSGGGCCDKC